jgi:hypothetical protein
MFKHFLASGCQLRIVHDFRVSMTRIMRPIMNLYPSFLFLFPCVVILSFNQIACSNRCFGLTAPILYVDDSAGRLGTINLHTQETAVVGSLGVVLTDIAFSPTGSLFGVSPIGLWQIDPETAATQYIGDNGFFGLLLMNALGFDNDGRLYAAAANSTLLYEVNPTTGLATPVADMGVLSTGDLVFDDTRNLYLSGNDSNLYAIDRDTGQGTWIGPFGFSEVLGLAADPLGDLPSSTSPAARVPQGSSTTSVLTTWASIILSCEAPCW